MRSSHVAVTFAAVATGLTAAVALHRRPGRGVPAPASTPVPAAAPIAAAPVAAAPVAPVLDREGVVLPFVRPGSTAPVAAQPAAPARCGENGGRTKAGAPCAARAVTDGRCHHHRVAA